MQRIFILIKCVYYLFPESLQREAGGIRRLTASLQDDTNWRRVTQVEVFFTQSGYWITHNVHLHILW